MASSLTLTKISLSLSLLFFISSSFSYARTSPFTNDLRLSPAEKLIRSLNLFPKKPVNIRASERGFVPGKLVEKKFSFLGASGPSVEDLGHHAGYYSLPHTKAAR